jgi:hypothetical protein
MNLLLLQECETYSAIAVCFVEDVAGISTAFDGFFSMLCLGWIGVSVRGREMRVDLWPAVLGSRSGSTSVTPGGLALAFDGLSNIL